MAINPHVKKWKLTYKRVIQMLNLSYEEETFNTEHDSDIPTLDNCFNDSVVSINSIVISLTGNFSEPNSNSELPSNSDSELFKSEFSPFSDSDIDSMNLLHEISLGQKIAACAIRNRWSRESVNELLDILRDKHAKLPKDARTLLRIPRDITISKKCGVEYCYFGIQKEIEGILLQNRYEYSNTLKLVFNIDGLPLFKSAGIQLWPILGYFDSFDIFIIAIYSGGPKPNSLSEYLEHFVNELNHLFQNGFNFL